MTACNWITSPIISSWLPLWHTWHFTQWRALIPNWTYQAALDELKTHIDRRAIPTTLIALNGTELVGSVSLIVEDLPQWRQYTPWLASLYVASERRGRGVGTALVERTIVEARALGAAQLHLWTSGQEAYYQRLGWNEQLVFTQAGRKAHIMIHQLLNPPERE